MTLEMQASKASGQGSIAVQDRTVRIAGESGEGIILAGELLTLIAAASGFNVFTFRTYPAEVKGGQCMFQLRLGIGEVPSHGDHLDLLIAFDEHGYFDHVSQVKKKGMVLYNSDVYQPKTGGDFQLIGVPLDGIALKEVGFPRAKNTVAVGYASRLLGLPREAGLDVFKSRLTAKGEAMLTKNTAAFERGYMAAAKNNHVTVWSKLAPPPIQRLVLTGNQALALGAAAAGCRMYAGYPITPATDIMESLTDMLPKLGGTVVQTEDEMAALGLALGASYAGVKAMTATSGPGISLMSELIGLASMSEVPVVIVDAQRAGPSTGMPTKTAQSDLNHLLYAGHGDAPRIVLAPANVSDCFYLTIHAFNLAEEYQLPVIVALEQSLSHRVETIPAPDLSKITITQRATPTSEQLENYRRYTVTASGVYPMAIPGMKGGCYVATGIEHDERGDPNYEPETHTMMTKKRWRKLQTVNTKLKGNRLNVARHGAIDAEIGLLGWGASEGPIFEAVDMAQRRGLKVAALQVKMLSPLPENEIREFIKPLKTVVVPELNYTGHFAGLIKKTLLLQPVQLSKVEGVPFTASEIFSKILEVAESE